MSRHTRRWSRAVAKFLLRSRFIEINTPLIRSIFLGKHTKKRLPPKQIETEEKCGWGCGRTAQYQYANGRLCCEAAYQKCPENKRRVIETLRQTLDPLSGLNILRLGQREACEKRKRNGSYKAAGSKISETKRTVGPGGLTNAQRTNAKVNEKHRQITDGLTGFQKRAQIMRARRMLIGPDGMNSYQRSIKARLSDVDERGMNAFERAFFKSGLARSFKNYDGIYYQGRAELKFLEALESEKGSFWFATHVRRGPVIPYCDPISGRQRSYMADFLIDGVVYEIKSNWTWDRRGSNLDLKKLNEAKIAAANQDGYDVVLILEGKEIQYAKKK